MRDPIRPQAAQECAVALHTSARIEIRMSKDHRQYIRKKHSIECFLFFFTVAVHPDFDQDRRGQSKVFVKHILKFVAVKTPSTSYRQ